MNFVDGKKRKREKRNGESSAYSRFNEYVLNYSRYFRGGKDLYKKKDETKRITVVNFLNFEHDTLWLMKGV